MWSSTSNNDGFVEGGNSGAGFMNSPSQFASPAQAKKDRRNQNLVPVTIKTIHETDGDSILIHGVEVHMIVIVGIIRSVEVSSTKITYKIDDSTGIIEGVMWLESDSEFEQDGQRPLMEMTYCKLVGTMRTQMNKRHIMILNIVPITDINIITTHLLEVIHDPMKLQMLENARTNVSGASGAGGSEKVGDAAGEKVFTNNQGLVGLTKLIYERIKIATDEIGVNKTQLRETFRGKISPNEIEKHLEELSNEGLIFCSIDEEHFKTSENF